MKTTAEFSEALHHVLVNPTHDVVGLVDDLLRLCRAHRLQLDWRAGRCRVRSLGSDWEEWIDIPLRKSVFRAMLAHIAVLCNARAPNSVSLYGGQGRLSVGASPAAMFRVTFANTPAEQRLELVTGTEPMAETLDKEDGTRR
ncbi:MAG: hypothetical protein L0Z62_15475 [Gemmataceae bacterium]|nr:hypothetical protein [Gemmataceae bacterium]